MADALVSPAVAAVAGATSIGLIALASSKVSRTKKEGLIPAMGIMGAFVFVAQMINFTIPGTGSSGHIIGGILLAAMLGPWAGFLALTSVLIVQCLVFADGGLMALGCNVLNMAAMSCLVAYPLVYKPIAEAGEPTTGRIMLASVLASVVGLELGAFLVTVETISSGITALPFLPFLSVMLPIHLIIGACEGVATGLVLVYVLKNSPSMLMGTNVSASSDEAKKRRKRTFISIGLVTLVLAVAFTWIASAHPDGLEWSIQRLTGATELAPSAEPPTAIIPDYESYFAGIIGALIVLAMIWGLASVIFRRHRNES